MTDANPEHGSPTGLSTHTTRAAESSDFATASQRPFCNTRSLNRDECDVCAGPPRVHRCRLGAGPGSETAIRVARRDELRPRFAARNQTAHMHATAARGSDSARGPCSPAYGQTRWSVILVQAPIRIVSPSPSATSTPAVSNLGSSLIVVPFVEPRSQIA